LTVPDLKSAPVAFGTASNLRVGQHVHAIGAPKGLEQTMSEGLISSLRPYEGSQYIQTSAAISPGSSGGGLFDDQGRLVGITTFQFIEGQNLNFALPVDWIGELPKRSQATTAAPKKGGLDWINRVIALERKQDWPELLKLSQEWVKSEPGNVEAWRSLGSGYLWMKQYQDAVQAYREALRIQPEYFRYYSTWTHLGIAYSFLRQYDQAIQAFREALRINPDDFSTWHNLGNAYSDLKRYDKAIQAYREVVRI
jgi:tetratricopeptide (TPR) repeat protein